MKQEQYLSSKIREARLLPNGGWLTYNKKRMHVVDPASELSKLKEGIVVHGFVKGKGRIRLGRIWKHGDRMHVNVGWRFFRTNASNVMAIVIEEHDRVCSDARSTR